MEDGLGNAVFSPDDHGALLAMTTWFLACALVLCITARVGIYFWAKNLPNVDDWLIIAAAILAIGGPITVSLAVGFGLGKIINPLNDVNIEDLQRCTYAATILYVLTIGLSKLSTCAFLFRLSCAPEHKTRVVLLSVLVACWTIAITAGVVFQCELPHPWRVTAGKCIAMFPFWAASTSIDIVSDMAMILLPIYTVSSLQLPLQKKAIVMFIFSLRTMLIVLSVFRLIYLLYALRGTNHSFASIPFYTLTQAHAIFSVIIACSPALKPFMDQMRTSMLSITLEKHSTHTLGADKRESQKRDLHPDDGYASPYAATAAAPAPNEISRVPLIYISDQQANTLTQYVPPPSPSPPPNPPPPVTRGTNHRPTKCPSVLPTRSDQSRNYAPPPRPPPPPEELRPDMSVFTRRGHERAEGVVGGEGRARGADSGYGDAWAGSEAAMRGRENGAWV